MAKNLTEHNFFNYDCTIVADSINNKKDRLTTFVITIPRIILSEFNTHRMFSRNSASSRAIPYKKMLERVQRNPFIPVAWQKDHSGMQGTEYITDQNHINSCISKWLKARNYALEVSENLSSFGVTKQICNRLLEPFLWHTVIITSGKEGLNNFFDLRCPKYVIPIDKNQQVFKSKKDLLKSVSGWWTPNVKPMEDLDWLQINQSGADIHIQPIAELMWDSYNNSTPTFLQGGQWHIPFANEIDEGKLWTLVNSWEEHRELEPAEVYYGTNTEGFEEAKIKIAIATCARISYGNISPATSNYEDDLKLYDRLVSSKHASPTEHIAKCMYEDEYNTYFKGKLEDLTSTMEGYIPSEDGLGWCLNYKGYIQQRFLEKI